MARCWARGIAEYFQVAQVKVVQTVEVGLVFHVHVHVHVHGGGGNGSGVVVVVEVP